MNAQLEATIKDKLFTENEYGYKHRDLDAELSKQEVDYLAKEYGIETEYTYEGGVKVPLRPMCINCKAAHIFKYKDHPITTENHGFEIACKGVPADLPPGTGAMIKRYATENDVTYEKAKKIVAATIDPVSWFELMFNFKDGTDRALRPYQKEELRCTAKRRALRWGRRSGKTFVSASILINYVFNKKVLDGYDDKGEPQYRGPIILVATPFQAQLVNVFEQIEALLKNNVDLRSQVTTGTAGNLYVQSPFFRMEFSNGAKIYGFVTGVEIKVDGSAGGSMRGQSGDIVYVDEMDMIPEDIIKKVIIPILSTTDKTEFIVSSTPIGKAGEFSKFCKDTPWYRESYFPSTSLPHWDAVKKDISDLDPRDDGFISEYMAEFVESSSGVFKTLFIYDSMRDYGYADARLDNGPWWRNFAQVSNRSDLVHVIGIDWNKNAGSEFVVVSYHPPTNQYWVSEATNISSNSYSSLAFKDEVKRLNYVWQPAYIYADEGWGHHIIEDLLYESQQMLLRGPKTELERQLSKLSSRLKSFNFSQRVELKNPMNGTAIQRTGKEFLVENAVRVFESGNLRISLADNTLRKQLLNYVVLRRHASNNRPVYGMKSENVGDHRLDAFMLALGGIFLELNPLYSKNFWSGKNDFRQMIRVPLSETETTEQQNGNYRIIANKLGANAPKDRARQEIPVGKSFNSVYQTLLRESNHDTFDPERRKDKPGPVSPVAKIGIINRQRVRRGVPWRH